MANDLNAFFSALSDATRRAVVERLASGAAPVGHLHEPFDMALPTFLKHLKVLEEAGLLTTVKKGRVRICHLNMDALVTAQGWLAWQRAVWEKREG